MSEHRYRLVFKLDCEYPEGGMPNREAKLLPKQGKGATDALIVFSLLYPEDGSFSTFFWSHDGRNGGEELDDSEIWKVWMMLTSRLANSKTLKGWKKQICISTMDLIRRCMFSTEKDMLHGEDAAKKMGVNGDVDGS